jgi:hypothetical protein
MRDQYASDISDYLKFAFLRTVAQDDLRLGIAWYYLQGHDGRPDGRHVEYKTERAWRALDALVYDQLVQLTEPSVAQLEQLSIWPAGTIFHSAPVTASNRDAWVRGMVASLTDASLVFLDPDNGLGDDALKHARISDLQALHRHDRVVAIIKFPGRPKGKTHRDQAIQHHGSLSELGFRNPITVTTCVCVPNGQGGVVPRQRFFTLADGDDKVTARVRDFARRMNALDKAARASAECIV